MTSIAHHPRFDSVVSYCFLVFRFTRPLQRLTDLPNQNQYAPRSTCQRTMPPTRQEEYTAKRAKTQPRVPSFPSFSIHGCPLFPEKGQFSSDFLFRLPNKEIGYFALLLVPKRFFCVYCLPCTARKPQKCPRTKERITASR